MSCWKLRLSQEALAERFRIPVETQRAWERHEAEPTAVELAYLELIEREPEAAARALLEPAE